VNRFVRIILIIACILAAPFIIAWALTNQKGN
jgi:hypothetical protein